MTDFWNKKGVKPPEPAQPQIEEPMQLDEQAVAEIQEEAYDVFEEEEEDTAEIMGDANLRLEQGRLYQMVLANDIFGNTDADPKAIRNVQREIRKFVRERMETMLGIRQEQIAQQPIISSPFNDTEVTVLKMLAFRASGGKTEEPLQAPQAPVAPKKDGITAISGNLRSNPSPLVSKPQNKPKQALPVKPKQQPKATSSIKEDESLLKKPINEMTPEELAAHDAAALERRSKNYASMPQNMVPHPSPQALEAMYTIQASQVMAPGSAVSNIMGLMNGRK